MATIEDVRRLAMTLPGVTEGPDGVRWLVADRPFAWAWMERVDPRKPRLLNPRVIAVRVRGEAEKRERLAANPDSCFTEPHYDGYPAVLVRLEALTPDALEAVLREAWLTRAPASLAQSGLGYTAEPG